MPATIRPVLPSLLISAGAAGGGVVSGHADEQFQVALPELVDQQLSGVGGLGSRVLEAARGQVLGDRYSEDPAGHHDEQRGDEDPTRRRDGQQCDALQQPGSSRDIVAKLSALTQGGQRER